MNYLKIITLGILALVLSYASHRLSMAPASTPSSIATKSYQEYYDSISTGEISQEEFEILREKEQEFINEITSPESLKTELKYTIKRKLIITPIAMTILATFGFLFRFRSASSNYIFVGFAIITLFSLLYVNGLESLFYSMAFWAGSTIKKPMKQSTSSESMGSD